MADTEKTPAELEREKIQVEVAGKETKQTTDAADSNADNGATDTSGDDNNTADPDSDAGNTDATATETAAEETTKPTEVLKLEKTIERLQKRVGKTTAERDEIKQQLAEAQAALQTKVEAGEAGLTEEEVERRADQKAEAKILQREFTNTCNRLAKEAKAIDKTFPEKVKEMGENISPIPTFMIGVLGDLDNGAAVLNYLTDNQDDYEEIKDLGPAQMTTRLAKLSNKLLAEEKPKPKPISKVPNPPTPIRGNNKSPNIITDNMPMDEFVKIRNKQVEERRKAKLGLA